MAKTGSILPSEFNSTKPLLVAQIISCSLLLKFPTDFKFCGTLDTEQTISAVLFLSCCGVHVLSTEAITLWEVLSYLFSIFIMSFYFVGIFTFGQCLLTASITKIIIWKLNIGNNITNNAR